jgi:hypothetical protein
MNLEAKYYTSSFYTPKSFAGEKHQKAGEKPIKPGYPCLSPIDL